MTDTTKRTRRTPRLNAQAGGDAPIPVDLVPEKPRTQAKFDPKKLKPGKPGQDPIGVIGPDGHIFPFTTNMVDRFYLMHMNVTYIYDRDDLRAVVAINNAAIEADRDDRIVFGSPLQPKAREPLNAQGVSEELAQAFSPAMLDVE